MAVRIPEKPAPIQMTFIGRSLSMAMLPKLVDWDVRTVQGIMKVHSREPVLGRQIVICSAFR